MATTEAMQAADPSAAAGGLGARAGWMVIDGEMIEADFRDRLAAGAAADVPVVVGWSQGEGTPFVFLAEQDGQVADAAAYGTAMTELADRFGLDEAELRAQYPMDERDPGATIAAALGDASLACPSRRAARLLAERGPTWAYLFTYPDADFQLATEPDRGAFHSGEIQFVFALPSSLALRSFSGEQAALNEAMSASWSRFAEAHDPADAGGVPWPRHTPEAADVLRLDTTLQVLADPFAEQCAIWDAAR